MLQPNELRIGNYLNLLESFDDFNAVLSFDNECMSFKNKISFDYIGYDEVLPIPLNKDWLNKFTYDFKDLGFPALTVGYGITTEIIHFHIGNYAKKIEYVHELQNLYFALTGHELEVKE